MARGKPTIYLDSNVISVLHYQGMDVQLKVDYLMTWNHAHLANLQVQAKLIRLNESEGLRSPLLVSPNTIPWAMYGKDVRREDG